MFFLKAGVTILRQTAVFEAKLRIFFRLNQVNCGDVFKKSFYINKSTNQINQIKYAANNLQ